MDSQEGRYPRAPGNFGDDDEVHYTEDDDSFMVYTYVKLYTLNMCSLLYISYTSMKFKVFFKVYDV